MKVINSFLLGMIVVAITSCVSTPIRESFQSLVLPGKSMVRLRFQNMLGLELYSSGCFILNEGGVERMCRYAQGNPADLVFQIGPSFTSLFSESNTRDEIQSQRKALWEIWEIQKVTFYSVDALDLLPSLSDFKEAHSSSSISLLSSNLKTKENVYLFKPYIELDFNGKKIGVLSFSENESASKISDGQVEEILSAFQKVDKKLNARVVLYYVLGSLKKKSREKISKFSQRPVVFLGGDLSETNTVGLVSLTTRDFLVKTPDLGRGFGELAIGHFERDFWGNPYQAYLAGLEHSFRAFILKEPISQLNDCSEVLKTTKPQSLRTEALKSD